MEIISLDHVPGRALFVIMFLLVGVCHEGSASAPADLPLDTAPPFVAGAQRFDANPGAPTIYAGFSILAGNDASGALVGWRVPSTYYSGGVIDEDWLGAMALIADSAPSASPLFPDYQSSAYSGHHSEWESQIRDASAYWPPGYTPPGMSFLSAMDNVSALNSMPAGIYQTVPSTGTATVITTPNPTAVAALGSTIQTGICVTQDIQTYSANGNATAPYLPGITGDEGPEADSDVRTWKLPGNFCARP